jgi:hypothetical protein
VGQTTVLQECEKEDNIIAYERNCEQCIITRGSRALAKAAFGGVGEGRVEGGFLTDGLIVPCPFFLRSERSGLDLKSKSYLILSLPGRLNQ